MQHIQAIKPIMYSPYDEFNQTLLHWFDEHGRKDLPWQNPRSPFRVWISEIMLQQTQVKTVIPYFLRFIACFPDIQRLAEASEDEILAHWSGLGYYSRARNIHKTAKIIHSEHQGQFPAELHELLKLPGIGESTAAAIASLAFNLPTAILDGNVRRVLSRYFLVEGYHNLTDVKRQFWTLANECMPRIRCADYTQAIMDMGATCCTPKNPSCISCPLQTNCLAYKKNLVDSLPYKNKKKSIPSKHEQFLLLHTHDNLIYLEKRPPTGLWGGLWCLPSIDQDVCPAKYALDVYHLQTETQEALMSFKHTFSHFHLHIVAWSLLSHPKYECVSENGGRWFNATEIKTIGISKPVSLIINRFLEQ